MKNISRQLRNHIYLTLATLFIGWPGWAFFSSYSDDLAFGIFQLGTSILSMLLVTGAFFIVALPVIIALYITFKYLPKKLIYKVLWLIIIPLIGALLVPSIYYLKAVEYSDRWLGFGAVITGMSNLVVYVVNEIFLFINFKKLNK